jgi:hypothetical protein
VHNSPFLHTCHMPSSSHSSQFYHPHNIGWGIQIIQLHSPVTPSLLGPNILLNTLFSNTYQRYRLWNYMWTTIKIFPSWHVSTCQYQTCPDSNIILLFRSKRNVDETEQKSAQYFHDSETPYHHDSALIHGDNLASCEFEFIWDANHEYDTPLEGNRRTHPVALPCCIPHSARLKQREKEL